MRGVVRFFSAGLALLAGVLAVFFPSATRHQIQRSEGVKHPWTTTGMFRPWTSIAQADTPETGDAACLYGDAGQGDGDAGGADGGGSSDGCGGSDGSE